MILVLIVIYLISVVYSHHYFNKNKKTYEFIMYKDIKEGDVKAKQEADSFFEGYDNMILFMSHIPVWNLIQVFLIGLVKKGITKANGK